MHTPYLPVLRCRLAALGRRTLNHVRQATLAQIQLYVSDLLPPPLLSSEDEGPNSRERVFSLRLTFECDGEPVAISALRPAEPAEPTGPSLTRYLRGAHVGRDRVVGQHQAWRWPRPADGEWRLTLEWPDLGVPLTSFTVEGAG